MKISGHCTLSRNRGDTAHAIMFRYSYWVGYIDMTTSAVRILLTIQNQEGTHEILFGTPLRIQRQRRGDRTKSSSLLAAWLAGSLVNDYSSNPSLLKAETGPILS